MENIFNEITIPKHYFNKSFKTTDLLSYLHNDIYVENNDNTLRWELEWVLTTYANEEYI
jgi:hypothetical protein